MPSVEVIEDQYPLRFHEKRLRADSAGAGRCRGGLGTVYDFEFRGDTATFSCVGDRTDHTPSGVVGGKSAAGTLLEFTIDGETYVPPLRNKEQDLELSTGDRIHIESPGGGGYGDPAERETDRVREDIVQGYVSSEQAEQEYGVVVEHVDGEIQVSEAATSELRSRMDD